ncbi:hypothetical protein [Niastella vici]|nr:hypothetical protein [Niastella vici]
MKAPSIPRDEIISFKKLRAFIGFTGILLPIVVVLGCYLLGAGQYSFQHSVSHYYYTLMHIVFVSILCVLGGFLITYRGKDHWESRVSNLAGFSAFGIAAFPTSFLGFQPEHDGMNQYLRLLRGVTGFGGSLHYAFASLLFICFIIFCLYFFQKPDEHYTGVEEVKFKRRKIVYTISGWVIIISIIMIPLIGFVIKPQKGIFVYSTFIFETTSLWAFGTAWLVKGSAALKKMPVVRRLVHPLR